MDKLKGSKLHILHFLAEIRTAQGHNSEKKSADFVQIDNNPSGLMTTNLMPKRHMSIRRKIF